MSDTRSSTHPLNKKRIRGIGSWNQWLKLWEAAHEAEVLIGLLHYGFDVPNADEYVVTEFYLWVAHGHGEIVYGPHRFFGSDGSLEGRYGWFGAKKHPAAFRSDIRADDRERSVPQLRKAVAEKAWQVLCVRAFGGWMSSFGSLDTRFHDGWTHGSWWEQKDWELAMRLLDFFDSPDGVKNTCSGNDHAQKVSRSFVKRFVEHIWNHGARESMFNLSEGYAEEYIANNNACADFGLNNRPRLLRIMANGDMLPLLKELWIDKTVLEWLEAHIAADTTRPFMRALSIEKKAAHKYGDAELYLLLRNRLQTERSEKAA